MKYANCCSATEDGIATGFDGCSCSASGCECSGSRKFFTKEEKIAMLEEYKKQLEKETAGVGEKIKSLKKAE